MFEVAIFQCLNQYCRILTFKGVKLLPLNACPSCQALGVYVPKEKTDEQPTT